MTNELIGPLCGLVGVMVGAAVSSLGALATSRRGWNSDQVNAKRSFQEEVVAAAHSQLILLTLVRDRLSNHVQQLRSRVAAGHQLGREDTAYLHDENHVRRLESATHEWRAVLAKGIIYAEVRLSAAIEELDSHRANLTAALNAGNIEEADEALEDFQASLTELYTEIRRSAVEMNLVLVNSFFAWPWRLKMRRHLLRDLDSLRKVTAP